MSGAHSPKEYTDTLGVLGREGTCIIFQAGKLTGLYIANHEKHGGLQLHN